MGELCSSPPQVAHLERGFCCMRFTHLAEWLAWQQTLHHSTIELGLDRVRAVLQRLAWHQPDYPVFVVGGTNGKGSCVALLDSLLSAGGYRVGTFTSPHLIHYNERICIAGRNVSDAALVDAFARIDSARGEISLTFFEFNTLAALLIFESAQLDAMVLEVGMGGELDAVNVVDADVAIVSSVALDHCEWLGSDVETIGRVKAGIFRRDQPALFGSRVRPQSIDDTAAKCGARLLCLGRDFDVHARNSTWDWQGVAVSLRELPQPALSGSMQFENAATVLTALECIQARLPLAREAIETGLRNVQLAGRFQSISTSHPRIEWLLDVAHNPAAAITLADNLAKHASTQLQSRRTLAICGMLGDKDIAGVIAAVQPHIDVWIVAGVEGPRALSPQALARAVSSTGAEVAHIAVDVAAACEHARGMVSDGDRIVVFGSFHTVGPALAWLRSANT
jgi:dihydrofolate synthase/folylpolyglutamate synthase